MIVLAARTPFLEKHRAQLYDFFEDELRAVHWFADPANRSEMVAFLARVTKQPAKRFDNYAFTKKDYYRDNLARPNLDSLQHDVDTQFKLGFIKSALEVRKYADLSFVEEAARRLR
jgi:sulfonate transport system substrate-binding protein